MQGQQRGERKSSANGKHLKRCFGKEQDPHRHKGSTSGPLTAWTSQGAIKEKEKLGRQCNT
eukprot:829943-Pelagomonas_calceolata.AAC.1